MNTKKSHRYKVTASYEEELLRSLKDPEESLAYLKVSFEDNDPAIFLTALGRVAKANGGLTKLAKKTGLNRENLYRSLSTKGNPKLNNIDALLRTFGMKLTVEAIKPSRRKAA